MTAKLVEKTMFFYRLFCLNGFELVSILMKETEKGCRFSRQPDGP